ALYLADVPLDDRAAFNGIRQSLAVADDPFDPWDATEVESLLRRLVRALDHDGMVITGGGSDDSTAALVDPSWVLFLRSRRADYQGFLDDMRSLYRDGCEPPAPLQAVVVDAPST